MKRINPTNVVHILGTKLRRAEYGNDIGAEDMEFADILYNIIIQKYNGEDTEIHDVTLDRYTEFEGQEEPDPEGGCSSSTRRSSPEQQEQSSQSEYELSPPKKARFSVLADIEDSVLENIYEDYYNRGFNSYSKLMKRYKCIKSKSNCTLILNYVSSKRRAGARFKGNRLSQLQTIKEHVISQFDSARTYGSTVHYWHLQMWALDAAKMVGLDNFKASISFIDHLKAEYGITSRHITTFVTRKDIEDDNSIREKAQQFVEEVNMFITEEGVEKGNVWNSDQSQFQYEMSSASTLSHRGEKTTASVLQSVHSSTHSYTIDVALSMAGRLANKLYICFQETQGTFGPNISKKLETTCPRNIHVEASKSGKMTKEHMKRFLTSVLGEHVTSEKSLLLCDSWSGHTDRTLLDTSFPNKDVMLKILPPKTTKYCQPLDVYFFRQYKLYIRRITDFVRLQGAKPQVKIHDRYFIMKLHSVIYNQFAAPTYKPMLQYAWRKPDYDIDIPTSSFENVISVAFDIGLRECESDLECDNVALVRCAHCSLPLCFNHFIDIPHLHFED